MTNSSNKYTRISKTHHFGIHVGFDEFNRSSLFVKLSKKPNLAFSNKYLFYECNQRKDQRWGLTISLMDEQYKDVFSKLVDDLVQTVLSTNNPLVAERKFINRFIEWQSLFEKEVNSSLSFTQIVGLLGELYFLKEFMIPKYGANKSLAYWVGPTGADKDFILEQTWYEVKTKSINKEFIHLNSNTQLVSENIGYLTVLTYEKTSIENSKSINLFNLYSDILYSLQLEDLKETFKKKLRDLNFVLDEKYKEVNIQIHNIEFYEVNEHFPRISLDSLENIIFNINYDLFLPGIQQYKTEV